MFKFSAIRFVQMHENILINWLRGEAVVEGGDEIEIRALNSCSCMYEDEMHASRAKDKRKMWMEERGGFSSLDCVLKIINW